MEFRKFCFKTFFGLSLIFFMASLLSYISYKSDMLHLKALVEQQIAPEFSTGQVEPVTHWVYKNQGFKKNHDFFLFKALGPTPIQVLEQGGDCADKSRLLVAMLDAIGIDSTLAMLYTDNGNTPTHTIVEIRDKQFKAVADPVFDMVFPKPTGGFYGLQELRNNPALLTERLDALVQARGGADKIAYYKRADETYQYATTINWNKNGVMRLLAGILKKLGIQPEDIGRPHFLDDPKRFIAIACFMVGVTLMVFAMLLTKRRPEAAGASYH